MEKAIVALILAIIQIVNLVAGPGWWSTYSEETIGIIVAALGPILVWLIPNRRYG
jgi:hypothetical protein